MAETAEKTAAATNGKTPQLTEYIVLQRVEVEVDGQAGHAWQQFAAPLKAGNREQAVKKATEKADQGGVFKAVAASAWRGSLNVEKKQVTQTSFAEVQD